jgi:hypothetical protein
MGSTPDNLPLGAAPFVFKGAVLLNESLNVTALRGQQKSGVILSGVAARFFFSSAAADGHHAAKNLSVFGSTLPCAANWVSDAR